MTRAERNFARGNRIAATLPAPREIILDIFQSCELRSCKLIRITLFSIVFFIQ